MNEHSNLARMAETAVLCQSLPLLTQFLTNQTVIDELRRQGKAVDFEELINLWLGNKDYTTAKSLVVKIPL